MVVVLSNENRALLYASRDLKVWEEVSTIHGAGAPGRIWECPLLIELPVEGSPGETRWIFKVDALHDGPGSGAIYQTGTFDGMRFVPDGNPLQPAWHAIDHGRDFYAAIAWHEPRDQVGRPLWIGWIGNHAYQGMLPRQGWRGAMSVPRRLSLVRQGQDWALRQKLEPAAIAGVPPASLDSGETPPCARLDLPHAREFRLDLADGQGRSIAIERREGALRVTRHDPVTPALEASCEVAGLRDGTLTLWLDRGSIEVFGNDGLLVLTLQHRLSGDRWSLSFEESAEALA
jgi:sucrose-6-phosphate hydrolase SacC (GH32 family)